MILGTKSAMSAEDIRNPAARGFRVASDGFGSAECKGDVTFTVTVGFRINPWNP